MEFLHQNKNKFWNEFVDDLSICPSNYGEIWQNSFQRNQMDSLLNSLQSEPSSRQNVISIWNGDVDGLDAPKTRNVSCITHFQVSISSGKLHFQTLCRL
jgi:thymidylate synthase